MRKEIPGLMMGFLLLASASPAYAATLICGGKVEALSYHASNKLMIKLSSMNAPVFFCSPEHEWTVTGTAFKTGPETCKAFYATFLAAKVAGDTIKNMYFDGDQVPAACDAWSSWQSANIRHFVY